MDCLVSVIVNAKDEEEALKKGKEALNEIAQRTVANYITFDSKEHLEELKVDQTLPPVLLASSFKGRQLIEEGWQFLVGVFIDALERTKLAVQYLTPEQIMEEDALENLSEEVKQELILPISGKNFAKWAK